MYRDDLIRQFQAMRDLNIEQLAKKSGLTARTVSEARRGSDIKVSTLNKIADALQIPVYKFFEPNPEKEGAVSVSRN